MKFSKLSVQFTNNSYDQYCTIVDDGLHFQPNDVREFGFSFVPSIDDVGREIKVKNEFCFTVLLLRRQIFC